MGVPGAFDVPPMLLQDLKKRVLIPHEIWKMDDKGDA